MLYAEQAAEAFGLVVEAGFDARVDCDRDHYDISGQPATRSSSVYTVTVLYPAGGQFDMDGLARLQAVVSVLGAGSDGFTVQPLERS